MDFSYEYTEHQQAFRTQVSEWLDRNAPGDTTAWFDSPSESSRLRELTLQLGNKGWLAPSEPTAVGGADLDPDLTVIVLEELNRRGLMSLIDGEAQALRAAINIWGAPEHRTDSNLSLAVGKLTVWRHHVTVSPRGGGSQALDPDSVGVTATPDADGYILNGAGMFAGPTVEPDILWTVALISQDIGAELPVCLMVNAATEGIAYAPSRALTPSTPRLVHFENVWVLRTDALGPEGEGHRVIGTRVSLDTRADLPSWVESETEALVDYARSNELGADAIRAQVLVQAYIASRISRLLRMRAAWLEERGYDTATAEATASLWRRSAASSLSGTVQEVIGPKSLLSAADPHAPAGGRFDRLARRELTERQAGATGDPDRARIASELGLENQPD